VAGHINGGPIPMSRADLQRVVGESQCYLELTPNAGNYRRALETLEFVEAAGLRPRLVVGTDTPSGTGVLPRAMLRNVAFVSTLGGIPPADAPPPDGAGRLARPESAPPPEEEPERPDAQTDAQAEPSPAARRVAASRAAARSSRSGQPVVARRPIKVRSRQTSRPTRRSERAASRAGRASNAGGRSTR